MSIPEQQQRQLFPNLPPLNDPGRVLLSEVRRFFHENLLGYPMKIPEAARVFVWAEFVIVFVPDDGYIPTDREALMDQAIRPHISDTNTLGQLLTARTCFIISNSSSLVNFAGHIRRIRPRSVYIQLSVFDHDEFGAAERMVTWEQTVFPHGYHEGARSHLANWACGVRLLASHCRLNVRFAFQVPYRDYAALREETEALRMTSVDCLIPVLYWEQWVRVPYPDLNCSMAGKAITSKTNHFVHIITQAQSNEMVRHGTRLCFGFWTLIEYEPQ
ncbi:uncharacterized protein B0J16DRAFT_323021 [Fusarium flagelliforme]|uniref:Uncharacterized protein n=1 Tax=Fusarium flagelliforme TaxID=2675880 RepID=A0A395MNC3_9HYPO|nr:uncharacterized protein B0J16DRAFT_323021 [Fusarium flagelliforme]KAH7179542.1 hypothetical protein B0J16DRAFT_323021 [Fusarium flagelliforme]RFN49412.1 hypothetical protein FIE12Z_6307 [Fusarium flagelliforme]